MIFRPCNLLNKPIGISLIHSFHINPADAVINIREDILMNRVRHTSSTESSYLRKALAGLERYFFLLAFTSYVNESPDSRFDMPFSQWVKQRTEIWTMLENLRRKGPQLYLFRPVHDLSKLSGDKEEGGIGIGANNRWGAMFGTGRGIADELERFIVKVCGSLVLPFVLRQ